MKVEKAEYIKLEDYPILRLEIDGKEALIFDFKISILDQGFVPLNSRVDADLWPKALPPLHIPATEDSPELDLEGFTDDPVIVQLARDYYDSVNYLNGKKFTIGQVEIPMVSKT